MNQDQQAQWCEKIGNLLQASVWRGQHSGREHIETRLPTITFGSRDVAEIYALEPNDRDDTVVRSLLFEARLAPRNPFVTCDPDWIDPFWCLDEIATTFGRPVMECVAECLSGYIVETNGYEELHAKTGLYLDEMVAAWPDRISYLPPVEIWRALEIEEFADAVRARGHDLVVLGGSGESAGEVEWHVLDPSIVTVMTVTDLEEIPEP